MKTNVAFLLAMLRDPYARRSLTASNRRQRPGKVYPRQSARQAQRYARQSAASNG